MFAIHGTPGGRIGWWKDPTIYRRYGLRRITLDRPGYGESTRLRDRAVADFVPDVEQVAEALGVDRFVVSGGSGGGPHALACAALLPDRVIRCQAAVSVAPYGVDGLDWLAGQTEGNVVEFQAALEGEEAAQRLCRTCGPRPWSGSPLTAWTGWATATTCPRRTRPRSGVTTPGCVRTSSNGLAPGADGWVDDNIAFTRPWGFDVADIRVPVLLTYGRDRVLVPAAHGDWLAAHVPGAVAWVDDDAGHFGDDANIDRQFGWLAGRS